MRSVILERLNRGHLEEVMAIERASFSTPWSENSFHNELYNPNSIAYAAIFDSDVIGYICVRLIMDEGHILNLAVRPDMRRQGIAKAMVNKAIGEMKEKGCLFIFLEVRTSNYAAKRLYEGLDFKIVGTRKSYYEMPREDAVVMMLEL